MRYKNHEINYLVVNLSKLTPEMAIQISKGKKTETVNLKMSSQLTYAFEKELKKIVDDYIKDNTLPT